MSLPEVSNRHCGNCGEHDPKRLKWLKEPCVHRKRICKLGGYCAFWKPKTVQNERVVNQKLESLSDRRK